MQERFGMAQETEPYRIFHLNCFSRNKGTKGKTDLIKLDNWGNDFERGDVDEYSIEAMDVGKVLMIQLHNDGGGWWYKNPDWFVNKITVLSSSQEDPFEFPCHRWVHSDLSVFEGRGIHFQCSLETQRNTCNRGGSRGVQGVRTPAPLR